MHTLRNRFPQRALLALPLALIAALAVACESAAEPTATREPTVIPEPTTEADLAAFLDEVDGKVIGIRGIEKPSPVPYRFLSQEELRDYLAEEFDDPEVIADIEEAEAAFKLLGLIPQDMDLFDAYLDLLNAQVLGAYDPEEEEFVVLQPEGGFGPSQEATYAHEYVHRLQDAAFGLDQLTEQFEEEDDRSLAFTALVEGDASAAQRLYIVQNLSSSEIEQMISEAEEAIEGSADTPYILQSSLEFPYTDGLDFVDRLILEGGFAAVDEAFGNPPDSTEQVLHPEKYLQREAPVAVDLPDTLFGEGWTVTDENTFGEFFLKAWLEALGAAAQASAPAAAGWGGDRYVMAEDAAGNMALTMMAVWDNPAQDAAEFFTVMSDTLEASEEFERVNTGVDIGIRTYQGPGGFLVIGNLNTAEHGNVTVITAASDQETAMSLVLAAVS